MIIEGVRPFPSSPVRLQLYAVLAPDQHSWTHLWIQGKPPVIAGDLYGVSGVFEARPEALRTTLLDPILLDHVFDGCP